MEAIKKITKKFKGEYVRTRCRYLDIALVVSFMLVILSAASKKIFWTIGIDASDFSSAVLPLLSIFANLCIYKLIQVVFAVKNIKLGREHWIYIGSTFLAFFIFYVFFLWQKDFIYYWDYSNYLIKQYNLESIFSYSVSDGIVKLFSSFSEDYTDFINVFLEFPFCLTDKTGDSYVLCQLFNIFLPILILLSGVVMKMCEALKVEKKRVFFGISFVAAVVFPVLHTAASFGQPDWMGIIFALSILLLTLDYRFEKCDISLYVALFISTACLILSRRWYMYFAVGYYFTYFLVVLFSGLKLIRTSEKRAGIAQLKNIFIFGTVSVFAMVLLFYKMISNILLFDYADRYSYYQFGGFFSECANQLLVVGIFGILMIIGIIYALYRKTGLQFIFIAVAGWLVSVYLFTRVQTFGFHHHLLLLVYYYLLLFSGIGVLMKIRKTAFYRYGVILCISFIVLQPFFSFSRYSVFFKLSMYSSAIDPSTTEYIDAIFALQADREKVKEVSDWINENCKEGESAYIIPHAFRYNPDIFRNINLPNMDLHSKVSYGFDVLGTHSFPVEIFDAKYVLTCKPFCALSNSKGLSEKLDSSFYNISSDKYKLAKTFDMGDGYVFYAYERIVPADREEILEYLSAFSEENEQYPDLFGDVINRYLIENKL